MKDIARELRDEILSGDVSDRGEYFRKETIVSKDYFVNQVIRKYPNMQFVKIYIKETIFIPTFHETLREYKYYFYSVFIDTSILQYLYNDFTISEISREMVIDLSNNTWQKQLELRNKLFNMSSLILSLCDVYSDDNDYSYRKIDALSEKNICIYSPNFSVSGYEFLNKSNFVLISNSKFISQLEIDDLCLSILEDLEKNNQAFVEQKIAIYTAISRKLKTNRSLTSLEKEVLEEFINREISKIERQNTLLVRSRALNAN